MATQTNPVSIPSSLNPGASEYVPLSLQKKCETKATSPQIDELLPPIDSVPRDVRNLIYFFVREKHREKRERTPRRVSNRISKVASRNGFYSPQLPLSLTARTRQ